MIYLYSGTPGSGKSLHTAKVVYRTLRLGLPVIANFNFNYSGKKNNFYYVDNTELTPDYLQDFSRQYWNGRRVLEGRILLVIDECQLLFNAREWNIKGRAEWLGFYTQHRKMGYDIILVAQFDGMIDRQIRALIEYEVIHRKVSNYGLGGKFISMFALGKLFCGVKVWYPMKEKVGQIFFTARKKYYSLYDTYNTFEDGTEEGGEPSGGPSPNVLYLSHMELCCLLDYSNT